MNNNFLFACSPKPVGELLVNRVAVVSRSGHPVFCKLIDEECIFPPAANLGKRRTVIRVKDVMIRETGHSDTGNRAQ